MKVEEEFEETIEEKTIEETKIDSKKYACGNCTSAFAQKKGLMTHIRHDCGKPPRYKCPYCDQYSKKIWNIRQHIRRKHIGCEIFVQDVENL